jgi:hypothetical protein
MRIMEKDIPAKFHDHALKILFSIIKEVIDWKYVQSLITNKIYLYSDKKKCQVLLALADGLSTMGHKFNTDDDNQIDLVQEYMSQFRFTRSLEYMKCYRNHFLVDVFGFCTDYDSILKSFKYSTDDALSAVNTMGMKMITEMTTQIESNTKSYMESLDDNPDTQEYIENMLMTEMLCKDIVRYAETLQCNYRRAVTHAVGLLFDIQSLEVMAFDSHYKQFQKKFMDEWKVLKIKEYFTKMVDVIIDTASNMAGFKCESKYELDKKTMQRIRVHYIKIHYDKDNFNLSFQLSSEAPIFITVKQ